MAGGKEAKGEVKWKSLRGAMSLARWAGSIPRSEAKAEECDFILGPEVIDHRFQRCAGVEHAKAADVRNQEAQIGPKALKQDQCSGV